MYKIPLSTLKVGDKVRFTQQTYAEGKPYVDKEATGWIAGPNRYADSLHYVQVHGKGVILAMESEFVVTEKASRWQSFRQKWALNGTCYGYFPLGYGYGTWTD